MNKLSRGLIALTSLSVLTMGTASAFTRVAAGWSGHPNWRPYFTVKPAQNVDYARALAASDAGSSLPFWNGTFMFSGSTYSYMMVGTDPSMKGMTSVVPTVTYAYVLKMSDGTVFDPTKPACGDTKSVYKRFINSPLYASARISENGVPIGKTQYEDAMQIGEFYQLIKKKKKNHVMVQDAGRPVVVNLTVPANEGSTHTGGTCGKYGTVDVNWLGNQVDTSSWLPTTVPIVFLYDVFQTSGGQCCIGGYHGAFQTSGGALQERISVGTYNDAGIVSIWQDITVFSHELGELINDPTGNNATPPWGHVGQVSGCQNNLGDPLTGVDFPTITVNGFTYHPQSWPTTRGSRATTRRSERAVSIR